MQVPAGSSEICLTMRASQDACLNALGDVLFRSIDAVHRRPCSTHSVGSTEDGEGMPSCDMRRVDQVAKVLIALHLSVCLLLILWQTVLQCHCNEHLQDTVSLTMLSFLAAAHRGASMGKHDHEATTTHQPSFLNLSL